MPTVAELIEQLSKLEPNAEIIVNRSPNLFLTAPEWYNDPPKYFLESFDAENEGFAGIKLLHAFD
jgi:hypothetical protein